MGRNVTALVVDDCHAELLRQAFRDGDSVIVATSLQDAAAWLDQGLSCGDLVILDVMFPETPNGSETFMAARFLDEMERRCRQTGLPQPSVILVSGQSETAKRFQQVAEWLRNGRIGDIVPKSMADIGWPFFQAVLRHKIDQLRNELDWRPTQEQIRNGQAALAENGIITRDAIMLGYWKTITSPRYRQSSHAVLIRGENGTGKEPMAAAIHCASSRQGKPFVALDVTTLSESMLESDLFGYAPDSGINNADPRGKPGLFEMAEGGTLFLDEIGNLSLTAQEKLLRPLETKRVRRISATSEINIDVRLITATNRNLEDMVEAGTFRRDFFERINVLPIVLPPLRERPADIPLLVRHFFQEEARRERAPTPVEVDKDVLNCIAEYDWPGNIRELRHAVFRMHVNSESPHGPYTLAELREKFTREVMPCLYPVRPVAASLPAAPPPARPAGPPFDQDAAELPPEAISRLRGGDAALWMALKDALKPVLGTLAMHLLPEGQKRLHRLTKGLRIDGGEGKPQTNPKPFHVVKALLYFVLAAGTSRPGRRHEEVVEILDLSWAQGDKVLMTLSGIDQKSEGKKRADHFTMNQTDRFIDWDRTGLPPTFQMVPGLCK